VGIGFFQLFEETRPHNNPPNAFRTERDRYGTVWGKKEVITDSDDRIRRYT